MVKPVVFILLSLPLIYLSRRTLRHPDKHGLYRLMTWEAILWITVQNYRHLRIEQFTPQLLVSSGLMILSLVLVIWATLVMRLKGKTDKHRRDETLFGFEKTTTLVSSGIFGYIRHPMYTSLLCLLWGVLLRNIETGLLLTAVFGTLMCVVAALIEERENLHYFGEPYRRYMRRSKRFIPFLI